MKRIVIIGCGGFVGSHLLDRLLAEDGWAIDGWDADSRKIASHLGHPRFHFHPAHAGSADTLAQIEPAIQGAHAVINLAAICNPADYNTRPIDVIHANLFDIYPIIQLCAKYRRWLLHFSTSEVYGRTIASYLPQCPYDQESLYRLDEDDSPLVLGPIRNQRWTYACAKQLAERLIYAHHKDNGLPFTIVRPLNFFGPRMDYIPGRDGEGIPRVLACFMTALFNDQPLQLVDGGRARRTIIAIDEAIDAIRLMLGTPDKAQNQIFNIGNPNNELTIAELANEMRQTYAQITGEPRYTTHPIAHIDAQSFYGDGYEDCDRRMPSIVKARRLLGWAPKKTVREVLLETMTHFHRFYGQPS